MQIKYFRLESGLFDYILHNATVNTIIPEECPFKDFQEMIVAGITHCYKKVIPYLSVHLPSHPIYALILFYRPGSIDVFGLNDKGIMMRLQLVFNKFTKLTQLYVCISFYISLILQYLEELYGILSPFKEQAA